MSNRFIVVPLIIILVLAAAGATVYAFVLNSYLNQSNQTINNLKNQLQTADTEKMNLKLERDSLSEEKNTLSKELENQGFKLIESRGKVGELETNLSASDQKILDLEKAVKDLGFQLSTANKNETALSKKIEFYECEDKLDMDYSSVMAASSRLMAYVDGLPSVDHTSTSFRNTLWHNADTKIYGISYVADDRETYSVQFLVFFNEFGLKEGVFYVDGQCWLDSPVR